MKPKEFCLSMEQMEKLDRIAAGNNVSPADLVALAVDALIAEANRHEGWLPIPAIPRATRELQE